MTEKQTARTFKSLQFLRHMRKVPVFISQCLALLATIFACTHKICLSAS